MAEYTCLKCNRVFVSTDDWRAKCALEEHVKYCNLPRLHKVLQVVLSPLGAIALAVFVIGGLIGLMLAPIAYPFIYAMKLLFDSEVYTWDKFQDDVYGAERIKSFTRKD